MQKKSCARNHKLCKIEDRKPHTNIYALPKALVLKDQHGNIHSMSYKKL